MKPLPAKTILRILAVYLVVSGLWIFFSDRWLAALVSSPTALTGIQTYKGWLFVVLSTLLLYYLLKREQTRSQRLQFAYDRSRTESLQLFSSNPIPMWVLDRENGRFLAVNDAALKMYAASREEFTALTFDQVYQPAEAGTASGWAVPTLAEGAARQNHRARDGRILSVQIVSSPFEFDGRPALLSALADVSEQRRMELAIKAAEFTRIEAEDSLLLDESRLQSLQRINEDSGRSLEDTTSLVLEDAAQLTNSEYSFIAFVEGDMLNVQASPSIAGDISRFQIQLADMPATGQLIQALKNCLPSAGEAGIGIFPGILPASGGYSACIPLLENGKPAAVAGVSGRSRPYTEADLRQVSLLAIGLWRLIEQNRILDAFQESQSRLAAAVENLPFDFWIQDQRGRFVLQNQPSQAAWGNLLGKTIDEDGLDPGVAEVWKAGLEKAASGRLVRAEVTYPDRQEKGAFYNIIAPIRDGDSIRGTLGMNISIAALKQRERELAALVSIASAMRAASNQVEMRASIVDQVMDLLQIDAAALVSQQNTGEDLCVELARGVWEKHNETHLKFPDANAQDIFNRGEVHWSSYVREDPVMAGCPLFDEMQSGACIPLKTRLGVHHALWVGSNHALTGSQIHLLEAIADIAGSAIHRAELNEQTERSLQRMTALRAIDLAITSSLDVRLTLNILLSQIISQLDIDAAAVLLFSQRTKRLEHAVSRGFKSRVMEGLSLQIGESHAGLAALERRQIFIPDLPTNDPELYARLKQNGDDFASFLAQPLTAKGQVKGVLEIFQRNLLATPPDWLDFLDAVSTQAAIAIDNAELFDTLQRANTDLTVAYDATIEGWSKALELRDQETQGHTKRVTGITLRLAELMGITGDDLVHIRRGVLLHDIGKMAIPDRILLKPGSLTPEEWSIMRQHPRYAFEMLSSIPYLRPSVDIPYCHHERWDGKGYPRGLKGEDIPLAARLFAVVDIWDALISDRPYRQAWDHSRVIEYLHEQAGTRLDPAIVSFFIAHVQDL